MYHNISDALLVLQNLEQPTIEALYQLVSETSAQRENPHSNEITVLVISHNMSDLDDELLEKQIQSHYSVITYIHQTPIGKLLRSNLFLEKLKTAVHCKYTINHKENFQKILFNEDLNGNRLPIDFNHLSFWDLAYQKFIREAQGNFRITLNPNDFDIKNQKNIDDLEMEKFKNSAFYTLYFPEVLLKENKKITLNFIEISHLKLSWEDFSILINHALEIQYLSYFCSQYLANFISFMNIELTENLYDEIIQRPAINEWIKEHNYDKCYMGGFDYNNHTFIHDETNEIFILVFREGRQFNESKFMVNFNDLSLVYIYDKKNHCIFPHFEIIFKNKKLLEQENSHLLMFFENLIKLIYLQNGEYFLGKLRNLIEPTYLKNFSLI